MARLNCRCRQYNYFTLSGRLIFIGWCEGKYYLVNSDWVGGKEERLQSASEGVTIMRMGGSVCLAII